MIAAGSLSGKTPLRRLVPLHPPSLPELKGLPLVQLEFTASSVPWRLNEPEAD
jgi:hypothetical protein